MAEQTARFGRVGIDVGDFVTRKYAPHGDVVTVAFHDLVGLIDHHAIAAEGSE